MVYFVQILTFFDVRGFAEYQSSRSWAVSENAYNVYLIILCTLTCTCICFNIAQPLICNMVSIISAGRVFLVKSLITFEPLD